MSMTGPQLRMMEPLSDGTLWPIALPVSAAYRTCSNPALCGEWPARSCVGPLKPAVRGQNVPAAVDNFVDNCLIPVDDLFICSYRPDPAHVSRGHDGAFRLATDGRLRFDRPMSRPRPSLAMDIERNAQRSRERLDAYRRQVEQRINGLRTGSSS